MPIVLQRPRIAIENRILWLDLIGSMHASGIASRDKSEGRQWGGLG